MFCQISNVTHPCSTDQLLSLNKPACGSNPQKTNLKGHVNRIGGSHPFCLVSSLKHRSSQAPDYPMLSFNYLYRLVMLVIIDQIPVPMKTDKQRQLYFSLIEATLSMNGNKNLIFLSASKSDYYWTMETVRCVFWDFSQPSLSQTQS